MALTVPPTPLVIALTQGGADAFVQGSVLTGLSGRQAYSLKGIAFEMTSAFSAVTLTEYEVAVTRRSKAAMPLTSDSDVIVKLRFQQLTAGAAYFMIRDKAPIYWKPEFEVPIVEETIYAQLDSAASAIVNSFIVRLDVELDTMSDIDRLNLITRSLT